MECCHLIENVQALSIVLEKSASLQNWCCSVCKTNKSLWLCLSCGLVNCGRYIAGHAKSHHKQHEPLHSVCLDCHSMALFCYICDEYVINDTPNGDIEKIRSHLQNDSVSSENHTKENRNLRRRSSSESMCTENSRKRQKKTVDKRLRRSGLRNLGNTCFMNAVLQSLSNIQTFCGYIQQLPSLEQKMSKKKITTRSCTEGNDVFVVEELRKTLVALWQGSKAAISPESLFSVIWKVVPRFRGYQQQDAHEFMRYLLDRLNTELMTLIPYNPVVRPNSPYVGSPLGKSSVVTAIFGGILQSEVNCLICSMDSKKHDPFLDISLDIPSKFSAKTPTPKNGEMVCDLNDCLSSFTDVEELEDSELYMCANCKCKQRSTKKFWIRRLPNVLCLHLKRFRWSTYLRVKVDTHINFPLKGLDMSHFMLNNLHETRNSSGSQSKYDLAAVVVHHGSGAGSGHYTSYAVHEGVWYHFNDSTVTQCDEATVVKCKAYILFYVRRDIRLPDTLCSPATPPAQTTSN